MKMLIKILLLLLLVSSMLLAQGKTTANGIGLIKYYEGLRTKSYRDVASIYTIGYGHTGRDVLPGQLITEYQAEQLLIKDVVRFENYVNKTIMRLLRWHEFDALISFTFNAGYQLKNGLKLAVNNGNTGATILLLKRYNRAKVNGVYVVLPGLVKRRTSEAQLYANTKANIFKGVL